MKNFKLYIYKNERYRILITQYDSNHSEKSSLYSTFNEHLEFAEHDQLKLTFSLMKYVDRFDYHHSIDNNSSLQLVPKKRLENQFHKLFQMGSKVELVLDNKDTYIFTITGIKPTVTKSNVKFDYTCQDEVSYGWSRRNLGMSYSTVELGGVRTIYDIATDVLQQANIVDWRAVPNENNEIEDGVLSSRKITLEVDDSNPYNIIIEACNALNAFMKVNWTKKIITFYQKDKIKFSGYRYRPEVNLKSMDVNYDMDEMASIMHVYGGTDEYERIVGIMPALPNNTQEWWLDNHNNYIDKRIDWNYGNMEEIGKCNRTYTGKDMPVINNHIYYTITGSWSASATVELNLTDSNNQTISLFDGKIEAGKSYTSSKDVSNLTLPLSISGESYYASTSFPMTISIKAYSGVDNDFTALARKNPCLGNFLYNFDFFEKNKLLTTQDKQDILDTLEIKMAYNNMWLKYYEPSYWRSYSYLYLYIQEAKTILESLQAARLDNATEDIGSFDKQYQEKLNSVTQLMTSLYNAQICIQSLVECNSSGSYNVFTVDILQDLVDEYKTYLDLLEECKANKGMSITGDDYEKALKQADKEYYTSQYYTLLSVVGTSPTDPTYNKKRTADGEVSLIESYKATYPQLIDDLYNAVSSNTNETSIYEYIQQYTKENDTLWSNLYAKYGQYIYESKYENADELDSISLFNQAAIYYEDYNKPNANYSISVLELSVLEQINTPRLSVGSRIKVYNDELELNEKSNAADAEPLNNIQYTNNDLIVSTLSYDLRKSGEVTIGVEKITSYQSILQKLIKSVN